MKNPELIRELESRHFQQVSDYALIRELERRVKAMIENRGCLSDEFIAKLENLKKSAESVKKHF
jgi:hypothetical protein